MSENDSTEQTTEGKKTWPEPVPWLTPPWLPPLVLRVASEERGTSPTGGTSSSHLDSTLVNGTELMKCMYARADYRKFFELYGRALANLLEKDPEALEALQELLGDPDIGSTEDERVAPLVAAAWIGGSFVVGGIIGYLAES